MVDLHSHVLFDIDDGARDLEDSVEILRQSEKMGIKKMIATPHFTIGEDVEAFLARRERRMAVLKEAIAEEKINIELKSGAEVYITDEIFTEDKLDKLRLGDSSFLLAEFKYNSLGIGTLFEYVKEIQDAGLNVLMAHPERYSYLVRDMELVRELKEENVYFQVNAISLFEDTQEGDFARFLVSEKMATVIGSDIHQPHSKRLDAIGKIGESEKRYIRDMIERNPGIIFENSREEI